LSTAASASPAPQPERPGRQRASQTAGDVRAGTANRFDARLAAHGLPRLARGEPTTLQVDLRGSRMQRPTIERLLVVLAKSPSIATVDLLGGAELNPHFQRLVNGSLALDRQVVLHCTPELLEQPAQRDLPDFLAVREITVVAPAPAEGATDLGSASAVRVIQRLNALGYGRAQGEASRPGLRLHLTHRPSGPELAAPQDELEAQVRTRLRERHGLLFDRLQVLVNMPIAHFAQELERTGGLPAYSELLERAFNPAAAARVMCRELLAVDADGALFDCDFNRALVLPVMAPATATATGKRKPAQALSIFALNDLALLTDTPIATGDHCLGCAAGQGSGCSGALVASTTPATAAPSTS
jgi:radical SAM/Cys-rich protein